MNHWWMNEARCRDMDPEIFVPGDSAGVEIARRICSKCSVKAQCLDYALKSPGQRGVWGGTSERERRRLLAGEQPKTSSRVA